MEEQMENDGKLLKIVFGCFGPSLGRPWGPDSARMEPSFIDKFRQKISQIGGLVIPFVAKLHFEKGRTLFICYSMAMAMAMAMAMRNHTRRRWSS